MNTAPHRGSRILRAALLAAAAGLAAGPAGASAPACPLRAMSAAPPTLSPDAAPDGVAAAARAPQASFAAKNALLGPAINGCGGSWARASSGLRAAYAEDAGARGGAVALAMRPGTARWDVEAAFRHNADTGIAAGGVASRLGLMDGRLTLATDAAVTPPTKGQRGGTALRQRADLKGRLGGVAVAAHLAGSRVGQDFAGPGVDADRLSGDSGVTLEAGRLRMALAGAVKQDNVANDSTRARTRWRSSRADAGLRLWQDSAWLPRTLTVSAARDASRTRDGTAGPAKAARRIEAGLAWQAGGWQGGLALADLVEAADDAAGRALTRRRDARLHGRVDLGGWGLGFNAAQALHAARAADGVRSGRNAGRVALKADWQGEAGRSVALSAGAKREDGAARHAGWTLGFALTPGGGLRFAYDGKLAADSGGADHRITAGVALRF